MIHRAGAGITLCLAILLFAPFLILMIGAFVDLSALNVTTEAWAGNHTGTIVRQIVRVYGRSFWLSFGLAGASVIGTTLIGLPGAFGIRRLPRRWQTIVESCAMLPLAIPGVILAVGLIQVYGRFRDGPALLLLGHLVYCTPFVVRFVLDSLRLMPLDELLVAARLLGANRTQRLLWVILPLLRSALGNSAMVVFALSWGEFNVSYLLSTPVHQTYPAGLYAMFTGNSFRYSCVGTFLFIAVLVPFLLLLGRTGAARQIRQGA